LVEIPFKGTIQCHPKSNTKLILYSNIRDYDCYNNISEKENAGIAENIVCEGKKQMKKKLLLIVFILGINSVNLFTNETKGVNMFELTIARYPDYYIFGPPPIPPNYTTQQSITWDFTIFTEMTFRLTYNGPSSAELTRIIIWQEYENFGIRWNITQPTIIPPPITPLSKGNYFDFTVGGKFVPESITFCELQTEEHDEEKIVITLTFPPNIPRRSSTENLIAFDSVVILFVIILVTVMKVYKRPKS
jgi:hypothetical protein